MPGLPGVVPVVHLSSGVMLSPWGIEPFKYKTICEKRRAMAVLLVTAPTCIRCIVHAQFWEPQTKLMSVVLDEGT